ncbi:hypothetical protein BaRGS_00001192, partial [Batillaria attramentaria]
VRAYENRRTVSYSISVKWVTHLLHTSSINSCYGIVTLVRFRVRETEKQQLNGSQHLSTHQRAQWGHQVEFVLTLIGYAVGLGNVWRFPYLCFKNGGGAFLIPYTLCLIVMGIPMFALEVAFGQFGGRGPLTIWYVSPAFRGVGIAAMLVSAIIQLYYGVVIAWGMYYLFASMSNELPWTRCDSCSCLLYEYSNATMDDIYNQTGYNCTSYDGEARPASEIYFFEDVLEISGSIAKAGPVKWEITLCSLLGWALVFAVLCRGIESLGKGGFAGPHHQLSYQYICWIRRLLSAGAHSVLARNFSGQCHEGSSQFSLVETVITSVFDEFPHRFGAKWRKYAFRALWCFIGFLLGLPYLTRGGSYLLDLVDNSILGFPSLVVGLCELLVLSYVYGFRQFIIDVQSMTNIRPFLFIPCWLFISPVLLLHQSRTARGDPEWAEVIFWLISLTPIVCIPAWFFYYTCPRGVWEVLSDLTRPKPEWFNRRFSVRRKAVRKWGDDALARTDSYVQEAARREMAMNRPGSDLSNDSPAKDLVSESAKGAENSPV